MKLGADENAVGDHAAAEAAYRVALRLCTDRFGRDDGACAEPANRLALEVSNQKRFRESDLLFTQAQRLSELSADPLDMPRHIGFRALDQANRDDFTAAAAEAEHATQARLAALDALGAQAQTAQTQENYEQGVAELAQGVFAQAAIAFERGRFDEAEVRGALAKTIIASAARAPRWWAPTVEELLARSALARGLDEEARERLRRAFTAKRQIMGPQFPVALTQIAYGDAAARTGAVDTALKEMREAFGLLETLDTARGLDERRIVAFLNAAYEKARQSPEEAQALYAEMLEATQLGAGAAETATLARVVARLSQDNPELGRRVAAFTEAERQRDQVRLALGVEAAKPAGERSEDRIARGRALYIDAERRARELDAGLRADFPAYARLVSRRPATAARLQQLLRPGEAMLVFALSFDGGYVIAVRPDRLEVARTGMIGPEVDAAVARLRQAFEVTGGGIAPFNMPLSHQLHQALIAPVAGALGDVNHLILSPRGSLLSLPFGLLVTRDPAGLPQEAYTRATWLDDRHAISVARSVKSFADSREFLRPSTAPRPFLGIADPSFTGEGAPGAQSLADACRGDAPLPAEQVRGLTRLPGTRDEVRAVAQAVGAGPGAILLGDAATEPAVRGRALADYRVVYFATHGLLPGELPCAAEPSLALTPPPISTSLDNDGLLDAREIANLNLNADLVVLSACNTGVGEGGFGGESLSGLAGAFSYAGARALIVSHWPVDSRATVQLMTIAFAGADALRDPAGALKRGADRLRSQPATAHPFFWAPFTLMGDGQPVRPQSAALR